MRILVLFIVGVVVAVAALGHDALAHSAPTPAGPGALKTAGPPGPRPEWHDLDRLVGQPPVEAIPEQSAGIEHGSSASSRPAQRTGRRAPTATPVLVVGTTYDAFTPFAWARRLVADLGNARLLALRGDGHDVLTSFEPCGLRALFAYLEELEPPPPGTVCRREPPFGG